MALGYKGTLLDDVFADIMIPTDAPEYQGVSGGPEDDIAYWEELEPEAPAPVEQPVAEEPVQATPLSAVLSQPAPAPMVAPEPPKAEPAPAAKPAGPLLGSISGKYESGNLGVAAISTGVGDPGGVSYGKHQLASKTGTLGRYLRGSNFANEFQGMKPGTLPFNQKWRELAKNPEFGAEQQKFITDTHFAPVRVAASDEGIADTPAINEALYSIGVQHGRASKVVRMANVQESDDEATTVRKLFAARTKYVSGLKLNAGTKKSILNRYKREEKDILKLIGE